MNNTIQPIFCASCGKDITAKPRFVSSAGDGRIYCQHCCKAIEKQINAAHAKNLRESNVEELLNSVLASEAAQAEPNAEAPAPVVLPQRADYDDYIEFCLAYAIAADASDLHIKASSCPVIRLHGDICVINDEPMTSDSIFGFIEKNCGKDESALSENTGSLDFAFTHAGVRFRCNAYRDMRGWCVALRLLTIITAEFSVLGIPEILKTLSTKKSGLILITGPTGSGKTTTLSCLVDHLNRTQSSHIIMLEDPIEFVHSNQKCIISQREVGRDTSSYSQAIVDALREDPDIILVGEMRDRESIEAAIRAAETGHLVLSTLHTKGAGSSIDRIIDIFPPEQQNQIRTQLALSLIGVVSQQLVPGITYGKRWLATEIMINNPAIRNLIRQGKTHLITSTLQLSGQDGMYTMNSSVDKLLESGKISAANAEMYRI